MTNIQMIITVAVVILATVTTRFISYIVFPEGKEIPKFILYLGKVLAPAVFGLLVVYCFKNVSFTGPNHALPEIIATAVVALLYFWRKNMFVPIAGGTICYMLLVQLVFK